MTTRVEESVVVNVPVRTAYNQWTQFEDFPLFMKDVEDVQQVNPTTVHWTAKVRGVTREWDATITEQIPDARVAWESRDGAHNAGVVTFHRIDDEKTKVMLQLDFEPEGFFEHYADKVGVVEERATKDLAAFKEFIEQRGRETGGWRGTVNHPDSHDEEGGSPRYGDRPNDVRDDSGDRGTATSGITSSEAGSRDGGRDEDVAVDHRASNS